MFPRFDNLVPEQLSQITRSIEAFGWTSSRRLAECLIALRQQWQTQQDQGSDQPVPEWFVVLRRVLRESLDPVATAEAAVEFVQGTQPTSAAFRLFEESPRSLDILSRFSGGSPFLTQILIRDPQALPSLTQNRRVADVKSSEQFCEEARSELQADSRPPLVALRTFQRRESLRIGMCDVFGLMSLHHVTLQLSALADAMVQLCLELAGPVTEPFAVLALGKHGGEELNYSSDIDLVLLGERPGRDLQIVSQKMVDGLNDHLESGFLYRVDLRLRPWGNAGPLVTTPESWLEYLRSHAQLWEKQSLLKARCVAGDIALADRLLGQLPELLFTESADSIRTGIRTMKDRIEMHLQSSGRRDTEVKLGNGSIRDVEFLVQSLQLIHGRDEPRVASQNTRDALVRLADFGLLTASEFQQLRDGYVFLRTIEHALQLQHNRQTHHIPESSELRQWLALRVDYPGEEMFMNRFDEHRRVIRRIFDRHFRPEADQRPEGEVDGAVTDDTHSAADDGAAVPTEELRESAAVAELLRRFRKESDTLLVSLSEVGSAAGILTFCGPDSSELLTAIAAVLFSCGLDIRSGETATGPGELYGVLLPEGVFCGQLVVQLQSATSDQHGLPARLEERITTQLDGLLQMKSSAGNEPFRHELIQLFCQRMAGMGEAQPRPTELSITDRPGDDGGGTVVRIQADDSPGFLFELSNALNLCGFRIRRARIQLTTGVVDDELFITDGEERVPLTAARLEEVHTAATLIQQFSLWLPLNADPGRLLVRFRRLLQTLLGDPETRPSTAALRSHEVLGRVARVLSLSRHLWEDALQHQADLIPMLSDPQSLQNPVSLADLKLEAWTAADQSSQDVSAREPLNRFKNRHLFRIELRHVLGHCREFGAFSREITELAEVTLEAAAMLAARELLDGDTAGTFMPPCSWTLAGLGKFGGIEMGYASDIELLLVYDDGSHGNGTGASGPPDASTGAWFERLLLRVTEIVSARRDGIFEIDLRMRPWGQAGSVAVALSQFESYYSAGGSAWPYERQALVKLRSFGPDVAFGRRLLEARDRIVYDDRPFDFAAMSGLREQQVRQHVQPGTTHAKLSEGCLVDIEYSVQALQLTWGRRHESLRTENTLQALQAADSVGLLPEKLFQASRAAYVYFRQLIDCLRMVRGNAKDLLIPAEGSADREQLVWRLNQIYGDGSEAVSLGHLEDHRQVVRELMEHVRLVCRSAEPGVDLRR